MPGGKGKLTPQDNPKPFTSENQPEGRGRPPSFKKLYSKLLKEKGGGIIWVAESKVEKKEVDGITMYGLRLNRLETMLIKIDKLATGKNDKIALDAIKFLWEQFDGKAKQSVEVDVPQKRRIGYGPELDEDE